MVLPATGSPIQIRLLLCSAKPRNCASLARIAASLRRRAVTSIAAPMPAYDLNEYENPLVLLIPSPELADTAAENVHTVVRSPGQLRPRLPRRFGLVPGGSEPGQKIVSDAQAPDPGRPRPIPPPPMPRDPEPEDPERDTARLGDGPRPPACAG